MSCLMASQARVFSMVEETVGTEPGRSGKNIRAGNSALMAVSYVDSYPSLLSAPLSTIENHHGNLIGTWAGAGSGVFSVTSMLWITA
jgi:hypothetical protein